MHTLIAWMLLGGAALNPGEDSRAALELRAETIAENLWGSAPESHPGHYRVVFTGYHRSADQLTVAVHWQVRNPAGSSPADLTAAQATLQVGQQDGATGRTQASPAHLGPGQASKVFVTLYTLPREADLRNLWWGFADGTPRLRVHLIPHAANAKSLSIPHAPRPDWRQVDAESSTAPVLSVLEGQNDDPFTWKLMDADQQVLRLYTLPGTGTLPNLALHPQGKRALFSWGPFVAEMDLATGHVTLLPDWAATHAWVVASYDAQGNPTAVVAPMRDQGRDRSGPTVWTRYSLHGRTWKPVRQVTMDASFCDAWGPEGSSLAGDLLPQLVHLPGDTGPCNPAGATRADLNLPTPLPPEAIRAAQLPTSDPFAKKWAQLERAAQSLLARVLPLESGRIGWTMPAYWLHDGALEPVADFAEERGMLLLRWRGPYLVMGRILRQSDVQPPRMEHMFKLFDVRSRAALATWHGPNLDVALWPGPVLPVTGDSTPNDVGSASTPGPKGWVRSAVGTQQSFVADVPYAQTEFISDRGYLDKCRLRCQRNRQCLGFFEQTHLCPQPNANDHHADPNKHPGVGCYRICGFYDRGVSPLTGHLAGGPVGSVWIKETAFSDPAERDAFFH